MDTNAWHTLRLELSASSVWSAVPTCRDRRFLILLHTWTADDKSADRSAHSKDFTRAVRGFTNKNLGFQACLALITFGNESFEVFFLFTCDEIHRAATKATASHSRTINASVLLARSTIKS